MPIHLENEQSVVYRANENLAQVVDRAGEKKTKLEAWFEANKKFSHAMKLFYQQISNGFVWDKKNCEWKVRNQGLVVGRMMSVHATSGELFYLRMILTRIKGATSFKDLPTVHGRVYQTFKEACNALGLLDNDKEWHHAIQEKSHYATASKLRELFVHIIVHCQVINPSELWNVHRRHFQDDILYNRRRLLQNQDLQLTDAQIENFALAGMYKLFLRMISAFSVYNICL